MDELKPCPFCGSHNLVEGYHSPFVICDDCGAFGPGHADMTHDEAIAAWNSRAERTCEFAPDGMMDDRLWFSCSNCGGYITTDYGMPSYCPHCGARTVGE